MQLFLGVDGGQSSTTALLGDESGRVLGRGMAGPCNHAAEGQGRAKLEKAVRGCLAAACAEAGLNPATVEFEAACFGMSGGPDQKREILQRVLRSRILTVTNDADIALHGAIPGGRGIVVIAGTGSIALGRNPAGEWAHAGGWGYIFGDEGGAFDIVRRALRASLRMEEGRGSATLLRERLLEATALDSADAALHAFYSDAWPRSRVAALAPLVDRAAADGDAEARRILQDAAAELVLLVRAVEMRLWAADAAVLVAPVGGVFTSRHLRAHFVTLAEERAGTKVVAPQGSPAEGALRQALESAGIRPEGS